MVMDWRKPSGEEGNHTIVVGGVIASLVIHNYVIARVAKYCWVELP